ncbi:hypothetical protein DAEQUDRAFT_671885 [Daedalea quercina L-15889]|uniref:Late embryogenesis abundant protein LEA-2 subgroup domain-containing protein n=1 Tax=Daedalea quercina L-15889 TaxID=1314783 RepID=A0A165PEW9_9APHY|nr:hypothetical protein DAEQUDRAFT_671885 [Daedalea quercina L-15889]
MAYSNAHVQHQQYPPAQYDDYNPYTAAAQPHETYEQGGYNYDSGGYNQGGYKGEYLDDPSGAGKERERSVFDREADDALPNRPTGPKTSRNMRRWRLDNSEGLWTRGGPIATFGRFLCCTFMIAVFLFISIVLSLALWIRPPSVLIGTPTLNGSSPVCVSVQDSALVIGLDVNASISNPNYFSVELTDLNLDLFYPINNTAVGGGSLTNVDFKSHETTNITFPLDLKYNITGSSNTEVLLDLAKKCGIVSGSSKTDITVNYKATVGVRILAIPVKPTISSSFSFECPIDSSELEKLLEEAGISLSDLGSLL